MIRVVKIRMKEYCSGSLNLSEIKDLKLEGDMTNPGWFSKESIHDYVKNNNGIINVNIYPYPRLIAVTTQNERYVKSIPNKYGFDNLLELPRE